jgi:hypothetical protein
VTVESILLALDYITLGLRLWSRRLQRVPLQVNDYLIMAAVVFMTARSSCMMVVMIKCGVGLHIQDVLSIAGPDILVLLLQLLYAIDMFWITLVSLIKISILHFYLQVFPQKPFRVIVYILMGICSCFWIATLFAGAFFCTPPEKQWYPDLPGHCGERRLFTSVPTSTDLGVEILVILLPMPLLWKLQMPTGRKIALMFVFGLGFFIIGITAYRIKPMLALDPTDLTYSLSTIGVFASLVPLLGIINANLPLLAPAYKKIFKSSALGSTIHGSMPTNKTDGTHQFSELADGEIPLVGVKGGEEHQIRVTTNWDIQSSAALAENHETRSDRTTWSVSRKEGQQGGHHHTMLPPDHRV